MIIGTHSLLINRLGKKIVGDATQKVFQETPLARSVTFVTTQKDHRVTKASALALVFAPGRLWGQETEPGATPGGSPVEDNPVIDLVVLAEKVQRILVSNAPAWTTPVAVAALALVSLVALARPTLTVMTLAPRGLWHLVCSAGETLQSLVSHCSITDLPAIKTGDFSDAEISLRVKKVFERRGTEFIDTALVWRRFLTEIIYPMSGLELPAPNEPLGERIALYFQQMSDELVSSATQRNNRRNSVAPIIQFFEDFGSQQAARASLGGAVTFSAVAAESQVGVLLGAGLFLLSLLGKPITTYLKGQLATQRPETIDHDRSFGLWLGQEIDAMLHGYGNDYTGHLPHKRIKPFLDRVLTRYETFSKEATKHHLAEIEAQVKIMQDSGVNLGALDESTGQTLESSMLPSYLQGEKGQKLLTDHAIHFRDKSAAIQRVRHESDRNQRLQNALFDLSLIYPALTSMTAAVGAALSWSGDLLAGILIFGSGSTKLQVYRQQFWDTGRYPHQLEAVRLCDIALLRALFHINDVGDHLPAGMKRIQQTTAAILFSGQIDGSMISPSTGQIQQTFDRYEQAMQPTVVSLAEERKMNTPPPLHAASLVDGDERQQEIDVVAPSALAGTVQKTTPPIGATATINKREIESELVADPEPDGLPEELGGLPLDFSEDRDQS